MMKSITGVLNLTTPSSQIPAIPVVIDSPHSGMEYPANSGIIADTNSLRTTWDAFVDELWGSAHSIGASLLAARFPRSYIDPNRAPDDIDAGLLDQPWPVPLNPSAACGRGMGLIRTNALPGVPMYEGKISIGEIQHRLDDFYNPYHGQLRSLVNHAHEQFGSVWHIDCHSMKSVGNGMNIDNGIERPDFVISDLKGKSASSSFTSWVAEQFSQMGYVTSINSPYEGAHIVRSYGVPSEGRHSIQVEIKRSLYMDETTFEKNSGFEKLQNNIQRFLQLLQKYVETQVQPQKES